MCLSIVVEQHKYWLLAVVVLVATREPHLNPLLEKGAARDEYSLIRAPACNPVQHGLLDVEHFPTVRVGTNQVRTEQSVHIW